MPMYNVTSEARAFALHAIITIDVTISISCHPWACVLCVRAHQIYTIYIYMLNNEGQPFGLLRFWLTRTKTDSEMKNPL